MEHTDCEVVWCPRPVPGKIPNSPFGPSFPHLLRSKHVHIFKQALRRCYWSFQRHRLRAGEEFARHGFDLLIAADSDRVHQWWGS